MPVSITLEHQNRQYRWDGRTWTCLDNNTVPPTSLIGQLNMRLSQQLQSAEAEAFARLVLLVRQSDRPLRLLVTGSRSWIDSEAVQRELSQMPGGTLVIHGDAEGADRLAGEVAAGLGLSVLACPAKWSRLGKRAGLVRNETMLAEQHPDVVLAFHPDLSNAQGTKHMVELARKAGVPVRVVAK